MVLEKMGTAKTNLEKSYLYNGLKNVGIINSNSLHNKKLVEHTLKIFNEKNISIGSLYLQSNKFGEFFYWDSCNNACRKDFKIIHNTHWKTACEYIVNNSSIVIFFINYESQSNFYYELLDFCKKNNRDYYFETFKIVKETAQKLI